MKEIVVKVVNNSENPLPSYQTMYSSGLDLFSDENVVVYPNKSELIGTGIHVEIPDGYEMQIRSRSGLAGKKGIFVLNSPGTVDSDYRGEIKIILHNTSKDPFIVKSGDRIAQMVLCPVYRAIFEEVDELEDLSLTTRGENGFGHTGV